MSATKQAKWLAVHLFYNEPWEEFIISAIRPYVKTVMDTGIAEEFFFIRYWERGPHIRLRFRGEATVLDSILKPNLQEHFQNYFDSKPSNRTDPNYPPNFPEHYKWFPNNSVQYIPYEPETERFGGPLGMRIAERQFGVSSKMALQSLRKNWAYDEALGHAIKLHLALTHSMGLRIDQVKEFFNIVFHNWLPSAFRFFNNRLSRQLYQQQEKTTLEAFKNAFDLQREALVPFHATLWEALEKEGDFEDEELNSWVYAHEEIRDELRIALELDQLQQRPKEFQLKTDYHLPPERALLYAIYADFIHLTNNRLGISNKDEGYLAYLILQSMESIKSFA